jgi:hypothetical protein
MKISGTVTLGAIGRERNQVIRGTEEEIEEDTCL